ncbi:ComF family protein [Sphaerisporangium fuscum]|uniref:ComF family protein n=1 Tax=Sphaerisporangium fuscum TaxID=2835868 RepID=UPI001BDC3A4C|nr:phosphoribosyltransferase family protein [Sphaerisporangium fuscum]
MFSAFLDLILPPRCSGCSRAGAVVCPACLGELAHDPSPRPPSPAPRGFPECWSAARYEGASRRLILAYKERGRTALARPLAECLAATLVAAADGCEALRAAGGPSRTGGRGALRAAGPSLGPVALVPIPSSRRAVRQRGHDPIGRLAVLAARCLRSRGSSVMAAPVLKQRRRVRDQAGLSASERAANLEEAFRIERSLIAGRDGFWGRAGPVAVLVDDIVTTGTTLAEAARALRREGIAVPLAVTLAATPRRSR